jgi:hypothetical protein
LILSPTYNKKVPKTKEFEFCSNSVGTIKIKSLLVTYDDKKGQIAYEDLI